MIQTFCKYMPFDLNMLDVERRTLSLQSMVAALLFLVVQIPLSKQ